MINVSLFASSVRPQLYDSFFKSLQGTSVKYEVVFAGGSLSSNVNAWFYERLDGERLQTLCDRSSFTYIQTKNIKPAQCYEIARRACQGEVVVWVADDCEFPNDVIGKAYRYWKSQNNEKLILSIQTRENGYPDGKMFLFDMKCHTFFGNRRSTPLMAPLGMMSRTYLEKLGGFDRRFICGQYENLCVMMALNDGAKVEIFGDENTYIKIDHWNKSKLCNEGNFLQRPFATGYEHDRNILESEFVKEGKIVLNEYKFEPYAKEISLTESESYKGKWD